MTMLEQVATAIATVDYYRMANNEVMECTLEEWLEEHAVDIYSLPEALAVLTVLLKPTMEMHMAGAEVRKLALSPASSIFTAMIQQILNEVELLPEPIRLLAGWPEDAFKALEAGVWRRAGLPDVPPGPWNGVPK